MFRRKVSKITNTPITAKEVSFINFLKLNYLHACGYKKKYIMLTTCDPSTLPSFDNGEAVSGTFTNGNEVTLTCATNFATNDAEVTCVCDTTGSNNEFVCSANNMQTSNRPTCLPGKQQINKTFTMPNVML